MPGIVLIDYFSDNTTEITDAYREMAQINLTFANMCIFADEQQFLAYEEKLAESEKNEYPAW